MQTALWGDLAMLLDNLLSVKTSDPVVIILHMARVKIFLNNPPIVQSSKWMSRLILDQSVPEIVDFKECYKLLPKHKVTDKDIVSTMDSTSTSLFTEELDSGNVPICKIMDLPNKDKGEYWILAKIKGIDMLIKIMHT